jgi:hypothetical protein
LRGVPRDAIKKPRGRIGMRVLTHQAALRTTPASLSSAASSVASRLAKQKRTTFFTALGVERADRGWRRRRGRGQGVCRTHVAALAKGEV